MAEVDESEQKTLNQRGPCLFSSSFFSDRLSAFQSALPKSKQLGARIAERLCWCSYKTTGKGLQKKVKEVMAGALWS